MNYLHECTIFSVSNDSYALYLVLRFVKEHFRVVTELIEKQTRLVGEITVKLNQKMQVVISHQLFRCDRPCKRAYGVLCDGKGDCPIPISDDRRIKWTHAPGYPDDECRSSCFHPSVPKFECTTPDVYNPLDMSFDVIFCQAEVITQYFVLLCLFVILWRNKTIINLFMKTIK